MRRFAIVFLLLFSATAAAQTPDYAREQRWADEIVPALVVGDAVYLQQKSGHKFLGILTEVPNAAAAVIVVHGLGVHPDWNLIGALRTRLADQGYTTLSVQMPVLAADAKGEQYPALFPDAAERLQTAAEFLARKGYRKIAIASHSMGARMANHFLTHARDPHTAAWVAIGIATGEFADPEKLRLPILDIFGERDFPAVLKGADRRAKLLSKMRGGAQIWVREADHFFNGHEAELARQIGFFLDRAVK